MPLMKAVRIHEYGGREKLAYEDAPRPAPGDGEVLIRVACSTLNPFDCALHSGYMSSYFNHTLPLIPGTDVSGTIEQIGSGVTAYQPGDKVYGRAGVTRDGSYAEYVVAPATDVAFRPRSLDDVHAASLPHVTLTAWQALFVLAGLKPGQTVLIHGAAGGVGHIAVQLAKWRGAKVIGTASQNFDFLRELDVDQAIDYSSTAFEDVVRDADVVLDTVGGDTQERSWGVLKRGGMLVSVVQPPSEETATARGVRHGMVVSSPPIQQTLSEVAQLVDDGKIKPHVSATFPMREIQQAHAMIEARHTRGKIVLQIAQ